MAHDVTASEPMNANAAANPEGTDPDTDTERKTGPHPTRWWSRPGRIVWRYPFWTLSLVAAVALAANWPDYGRLLQAWSAGELPDETTLWGHRLFWWERLGKALQFVGGLTIILDLLDEEKLRARAAKLDTRLATLTELRRDGAVLATVEEREGCARDHLVYRVALPSATLTSGTPQADEYLRTGAIGAPPSSMPFGSADLEEIQEAFIAARDRRCTCRKKHEEICLSQSGLLSGLIARMVRRTLHTEERRQLERTESDREQNAVRERLAALVFWTTVAALLAASFATGGGWRIAWFAAAVVVAMIGFTVMMTDSLRYAFAIGLRLRPAAAWRLLLAELLDKRRRGQRLRKLGFALVVVGFQFDLLSS